MTHTTTQVQALIIYLTNCCNSLSICLPAFTIPKPELFYTLKPVLFLNKWHNDPPVLKNQYIVFILPKIRLKVLNLVYKALHDLALG